jgi:disease resistance protein RPM1
LRVALQLQEAEKSIKHFAEMKERWVLTTTNARSGISKNSNLSNANSHIIITASAHFIDEDNIVGIEENRTKLTNWLNSEKQELSIISVWGMGGIGKTTLVANVFKREKKHFNSNAWVTISQKYSVENILRSLISEILKSEQKDTIDTINKYIKELKDIRELKESVSDLLKQKNYLIVLDDMWDPLAFHDIKDVLIDNHQGNRIIITSRNLRVAFLAPENNRLELKPLLGKESWDLFCRKAFQFERNHECPFNLKRWAREIVAKCDGLPLALVSLGNMFSLSENMDFEWKRVHDQLTWDLDNNPHLDSLKNILNLSFNCLPRHLKNCFLYCRLVVCFQRIFSLQEKNL